MTNARASPEIQRGLRRALSDIGHYSRVFIPRYQLRPDPIGPTRAIAEVSIADLDGSSRSCLAGKRARMSCSHNSWHIC